MSGIKTVLVIGNWWATDILALSFFGLPILQRALKKQKYLISFFREKYLHCFSCQRKIRTTGSSSVNEDAVVISLDRVLKPGVRAFLEVCEDIAGVSEKILRNRLNLELLTSHSRVFFPKLRLWHARNKLNHLNKTPEPHS
jgi:hypothetical protein